MPTDEERLVVSLEARINDFEKRMKQAEGTGTRSYQQLRAGSTRATRQMESDMVRSTSRINQALAQTSTRIGAFGKAFAGGLVGGLTAGGIAAIVSQVQQVANSVAQVGDEAKRAGVNVKAFQELKYVAEQNRIGIDALTDGLKELNLRADEFIVTGKGSAAEAFQRLGYDAETLKTKLEDPSELFTEIIGKLGKLDKAAQIRIADELFGGTGGEKFVQLIEQGEQGIRAQIQAANDLGIVMDEQLIERAAEIDRQFNVIANTVGTALRSAIVSAADSLSEFIDSFRSFENQRKRTLEGRQSELGMRRIDIEKELSDIKSGNGGFFYSNPDGPLAKGKIHELELELARIAAEEAQIVRELGKRVGQTNRDASRWTPPVAPPGGFGSSTTTAGKSPYDTARRFSGANENRDSDLLSTFFRQANQNVDPKMTAWCAAFVNAALGANGLKGTGSLSARSFLDYGEATSDPRQGDIVVLKRGTGSQGHVGFFEGYDENGNVRVFGGNQSDGVNTKSFNREDVLGYRSVPGADRGSLTDTLGDELGRRLETAESMQERAAAYDEVIAKAREFIAEQGLEGQALGMTEQAAARLRYEQDLLNEARQAGIELSPTQIENIKALAAEMAAAEAQTVSLARSQEDLRRSAEEFAAVGRDVAKGFIDDLINGESAADALKNALSRIADVLLDQVLDAIFQVGDSAGGGGGIVGNILSSIFGGIGNNANGTDNWRGGPTWVGERGPEIVDLPRGARVIPNHRLGAQLGANTANNSSGGESVSVGVEVYMRKDGTLDAFVRNISREEGAGIVKQGLGEYRRNGVQDDIKRYNDDPHARG